MALLTLSIHEALQLNTQAVVTPLKDHCIIKIFQKYDQLSNKTDLAPKSINKNEQRFNGYDEDELKEHYTLIFNEIISLDDFLELVLVDIFNNELNFHSITNEFYEKNALAIIKKTIATKLTRFVNNNEDYLCGLAGYIFRIYFITVHEKIAFYLLKQLYLKDLKIIHFLEYYNKKSISLGAKFYNIPIIKNEKGDMWNLTAITSISGLWLKPYTKYEEVYTEYNNLLKSNEQEIRLMEILDKKIEPLSQEVRSLSNGLKKITTFIKSFENKLQSLKTKEERDSLKKMNNKKYLHYQEQYNTYLPPYKEKKSKLEKMIHKRQLHEHNKEKNNSLLTQYKSDLKQLEKNYVMHQGSFDAILHALTNALIQRKKLIK